MTIDKLSLCSLDKLWIDLSNDADQLLMTHLSTRLILIKDLSLIDVKVGKWGRLSLVF